MDVTPILQPYAETTTTLDVLQQMLNDPQIDRVTLVSAWGKRSAFRRLEGSAAAFRARGGFLRTILGLSQGGASKEGLETALEIADEAYVVFDPDGRTFHPKMYIASGDENFQILMGSSNLTSSGMSTNFEANTLLKGSLANSSDIAYFLACEHYVSTIIEDSGVSKALDSRLIHAIEADPQIKLGFEYTSENSTNKRALSRTTLFESSSRDLTTATPFPKESRAEASLRQQLSRHQTLTDWSPLPDTTMHWSKLITKANSMRTGAHPTGHLTLTKSVYDIDAAKWFRNTLFGECEWIRVTEKGREREQCMVDFEVRGLFVAPTVVPLQVDHTPSWQSDQKNRTTSLRWGALMKTLKFDIDTEGSHVIIEKSASGRYTLSFAKNIGRGSDPENGSTANAPAP